LFYPTAAGHTSFFGWLAFVKIDIDYLNSEKTEWGTIGEQQRRWAIEFFQRNHANSFFSFTLY
jgi:hypothetical protein